jgi:PadR family transcriptional regulator PadR
MSRNKSDLLQGTLDLLILKTLALTPLHGYGIARRIQTVSEEVFRVNQGSLYPALHRLEKEGWIESEWRETDTNRRAKYYHLTRKGRRHFNLEQENWTRVSSAIERILRAT